ncbi:VOC family protein [Nocardia sp. NPDC051321]|uniref:VOC family protein n=1 Tax=Nocardia sp. NPDC051321 TaxID=3364323 RepID=UPI0037B9B29C
MPRLDGKNHVNLTVTDLDRSTEWYAKVLDMIVVNDVTPVGSGFRFRTLLHPASFASVVLGYPEQPGPGEADRFSEFRVGLHHLAYHVPERADLDEWATHLDRLRITHSGVSMSGHETGAQIWLRDPDNIWLEFYWVNREFFADKLRLRWKAARKSGRSTWLSPSMDGNQA